MAKVAEYKELLSGLKEEVIKDGRNAEASHLVLQQYEQIYNFRNHEQSRKRVMT